MRFVIKKIELKIIKISYPDNPAAPTPNNVVTTAIPAVLDRNPVITII